MDQPGQTNATVRFGVFEVDQRSGELRKAGIRIRLQDQPFQVLLALLERPGEVVTREDLRRRIWPTESFGDFDHAVNVAVAKLRSALGDSAEIPRYVETLHRRGYRFVGAINTNHQRKPLVTTTKWKIPLGAAISILAGLIVGVFTFHMLSPVPVPRVMGVTQITRSGRVDPWRRMVTDGSRIYFLERAGDHWNLMQTSVDGGDSQIVAAPFRNTLPLDISPDRTEFLVASFTSRAGLMPLWIWPVQGGAPRRVGEVMVYDARWFGPRQIIYSKNDGIYAVERDGSSSRLIAATEGRPSTFSWSPDGRRLRFTVDKENFRTAAIWEMDANGNHLHRLFPNWSDPPHEENGVWLADGSYYIFGAFQAESAGLWAKKEKANFLHRRQSGPVRLTAGPGGFNDLLIAGGRVFVVGTMGKAELVRFDPKSNQSATLFASLQPWGATYSRDGQWAVISPPGGSLRKIKADGTGELSLAVSPLQADAPAWSPDGSQVAFGGRTGSDQLWKLYVTSADGGTPREIVPGEGEQAHPTWSPDGKLLAFDQTEKAVSEGPVSIQVLNTQTNQISVLAGSQGKAFPSWSYDGRFVAALSEDERKLMLFDLRAQSWAQVAEGNLIGGGLSWSGDSKFLYFQDLLGPNEPVYRLRMDNRKIERVASFEAFLQGGVPRCGFQGLTPDGALLVNLLRNHADIYALSLDLP